MGITGSSPRNISVKNENTNFPPIQITRRVLSRLEDEAARSQSNKGQEPDPPSSANSNQDQEKTFQNYRKEDAFANLMQEDAASGPASPNSDTSSEYFTFKDDRISTDPLFGCKNKWEKLEREQHQYQYMNPDVVVIGIGRGGLPTIETVTAMQVRQEKEEELLKNDLFWSSKIKKLIDHYNESIELAHAEFLKKLEETQEIMPKLKGPSGCQNLKTKLSQCYSKNENQVLRCADIVQQFSRCVECEVVETNFPESRNSANAT